MKAIRIFSIIIAAALATHASAQQSGHDNHAGVSVGGGLNTMLYNPANGQYNVGAGFEAGLHYAHFFNKWIGLGAGLQYSWLNSYATYHMTEVTNGLQHPSNPGVTYNLTTEFNNFRERQNIGILSIPVEALFRKQFNDKWSLIGGIGVQLDLPVHGAQIVKNGTYTTTGVFPGVGPYVIRDMPEYGFGTYNYTQKTKISNRAKVGGSVIADFGARVALDDNWGLYCGIYFGYGFTNLLAEAKTDEMLAINATKPSESIYRGVFDSKETDKVNLLRFGLKLAIDLGWPAVKKVTEEKHQAPVYSDADLFEAYRRVCLLAGDNECNEHDSNKCDSIVAVHKQTMEKLPYSPDLSYDENRQRMDDLYQQMQNELIAQRDAEQKERDRKMRDEEQQIANELLKRSVEEINIYYSINETDPTFTHKERVTLNQFCELMKKDSSIKVIIIGHTCNLGNPMRNLNYYGIKRAEGLKAYMISKGVPAEQISCESKGDKEPAAPNNTPEGRAKNRRANIRVME